MKKQLDIKKLVLLNLPYLLMGLFATNFGEAWRLAQGANASEKFLSLFAVLPGALQSFWPSLHPLDLLVGLCCGAGLRLAVYLKSKNAKKYRHGMEYGSARWGTSEDIAPYIDPVFQNNVILTKTESLTMNSRPKDPKTARNKNVLVIGGSGSGKTRFWLKPNLMQMHSSYVVTDPKGTILVECGKMLQRGAPKLGKDGKPMKDNGSCPQMKNAAGYVARWEQIKDGNYGLLLWGRVGTGKSYFAGCIANALMEQEVPVCMTNFAAILNDLAASFAGRNEYISRLCSFPLLIIDDFGMERGTEYGLEQVYNVIDSRYRSRKPLIVTTNLTLEELQHPEDTAHARIYDRLLEMCSPLCFTGENLRKAAAQGKMEQLKRLLAGKEICL